MELAIVPLNRNSLDAYLRLRRALGMAPMPKLPTSVIFVVCGEMFLGGCVLEPENGLIYAEELAMRPDLPPRLVFMAVTFGARAAATVGTVLNMPIVATVRSQALRRLLLRSGWQMRDPATGVMVRQQGLSLFIPKPRGNWKAPEQPPGAPKPIEEIPYAPKVPPLKKRVKKT